MTGVLWKGFEGNPLPSVQSDFFISIRGVFYGVLFEILLVSLFVNVVISWEDINRRVLLI